MSDLLCAQFVNDLCEGGSACTWSALNDFMSQKQNPDIDREEECPYEDTSNFLSPVARHLQEQIEKVRGSYADSGVAVANDDVYHMGNDYDLEGEELFKDGEEYGGIDKHDLRKDLIEKIDVIVGSRKYPDRYMKELESGITNLVHDLVEKRRKECVDEEVNTRTCFDFPGDEIGRDEPAAKRLKNHLG